MLAMRQHLPYLHEYNYNLSIMQYVCSAYLLSAELNLRIDLSFSSGSRRHCLQSLLLTMQYLLLGKD